jgi:hypothetical protein
LWTPDEGRSEAPARCRSPASPKCACDFDRIEAEHYERQGEAHDIMTQDAMDVGGGRNVGWSNDALAIFAGTRCGGGRIALHRDSITGPLIGTKAEVPVNWQAWQDVTVDVADPGGTHELCFLFERNPGDELLFNLNDIDFIGAGVGQ